MAGAWKFFGVIPDKGRYDAAAANLLLQGDHGFVATNKMAVTNIRAQARDIKRVITANGIPFAFAGNKGGCFVYRLKKVR